MSVSAPVTHKSLPSGLVVLGIAVVAYTDALVVMNVSLGYLYLLPLAFSPLVHSRRTTAFLVVTCVGLREWLGPFEHAGWPLVARTLATFSGFALVTEVVTRLFRQRSVLVETIEQQRDELVKELHRAARTQRRLLPPGVPDVPGFDVACDMVPAKIVGGDYYDLFPLGDEKLGIVIGDVSGKGAEAGFLMPSAQVSLRVLAEHSPTPIEAMARANEILYRITDANQFVSLFYGVLSRRGGPRLEYSNAGHLPPLLCRAETGQLVSLETGGPVVGLLPGASFDAAVVHLEPGDLIVLYTDGVTEAGNPVGEHYSVERLVTAIRDHRASPPGEMILRIRESVLAFTGQATLDDDSTLVVARVRA